MERLLKSNLVFRHPLFSLLLGYVWIEFANPILANNLQIIPKIPNSAIALVFCWLTMPLYLKKISFNWVPVKWAIPFLLLATINIPFIELERDRAIIDLTSTWFWVLLLPPVIMKTLSSESGREHYVWFTIFSTAFLCLSFLQVLGSGSYDFGRYEFSHHTVAPSMISSIPLILCYLFLKRGLARWAMLIILAIIMITSIPLGARSAWLIVSVEIILTLLILPRTRLILAASLTAACLFVVLSLTSIRTIYSFGALEHLDKRWSKTLEWQEDSTVWKRFGMVQKALMMLQERPLLGVGCSNRSFASFDAGDIYFLGHFAAVRRVDAHNTYLFLLGGTGILGFSAFLYYLRNIWKSVRRVPRSRLLSPGCGGFLIATLGNFMWFFASTVPFTEIVISTTILLAVSMYSTRSSSTETNPTTVK